MLNMNYNFKKGMKVRDLYGNETVVNTIDFSAEYNSHVIHCENGKSYFDDCLCKGDVLAPILDVNNIKG